MKYLAISSLFALLSGMLSSCSSKTFPSGSYQTTSVIADGDLSEWNKPLRFVTGGGQVQYNVTNDNENLYVSLESHGESSALKILRSGINIYIDPNAGESKKICLRFPLANSSRPVSDMSSGDSKKDRNEFVLSLLLQANEFSAAGFKQLQDQVYDVKDKSKVRVAIKSEPDNNLGYEAVIPLKYVYGSGPITTKSTRNLSVGILVNGLRVGEGNSRNSGYSRGGGGGGMYGGGRGGGGGGRTGGSGRGGNYRRDAQTDNSQTTNTDDKTVDRSEPSKQDISWYKFKLADKKGF